VLCRQGKVTDAMLDTPKPLFVLTGMCEAAAQLLMMTGAAHLPGALLPLLMQTVLLWNLLFSRMVFGTR
jgi:drug/metabolite transporter (DMT)-like permease